MQWAHRDVTLPAHWTLGAREHCEPSDIAQSAPKGVILPVTSLPLAVVHAPAPAGLSHPSSHSVEDEIGRGECTTPSMVELRGLNAPTPHGMVGSGRRSSEKDEQGVVPKGEEVRTLVCSNCTSSNTLAHTSRLASSLSSTSSFSPSPSILPLIPSSFPPLVHSSVLACRIFVLVSTIIQMPRISYLGLPMVGAIAPCLTWEWEGIVTCTWN
jgi:hypothetical protein